MKGECIVKKLFGILVCLLGAVLLCASAAADVTINEDSFPDEVFRDYVKRFDKDGSGVLTDAELNAVDTIDVTQASDYVNSIQGIEFFQVLHNLNISGTFVNNPDLKQNKQLKVLDCHYCNNMTVLDLSQNWDLTSLNCDQCRLSGLDLSANPALETLSCNENSMASLNLKDHASLKSLSCDACDLNELNLAGCIALTDVVCSRNYLTSLDLRGNTELTSLDCDANQLTSLKLPTSIQKLVCSRNAFGKLNLSGLYNLSELDCFDCSLTGINLSGCTEMKSLSLNENELTQVDLTDCSFLETLNVSENKLKDIDLSNCFILNGLECWDNSIDVLDITWCLNLSEAYQKGTQDAPLRFVTRYSYHGSWLTVDEGQKIRATTSTEPPTEPEASIKKCTITVKDLVYTGKKIKKPVVTVKYNGAKLKEDTDYTFTYNKSARDIGAYKLTVTGKGRYTGSKKVSFKVIPKGTDFTKLTGGKNQFTLKWKKQKNITGYQIEYSLKKDFKSSKRVKVKDAKTLTTTIKKLKAGKKYYVRIRTYTTVKKKNYYSEWSKTKTVRVKGTPSNAAMQGLETAMTVGEVLDLNSLLAEGEVAADWITNDTDIVAVTEDGFVTAIQIGNAAVIAILENGEEIEFSISVRENGVILLDIGEGDLTLDLDGDVFGDVLGDVEMNMEIEENNE